MNEIDQNCIKISLQKRERNWVKLYEIFSSTKLKKTEKNGMKISHQQSKRNCVK